MSDILLSLRGVSKNFGEGDVLRGIDLDVRRGEFLTLLGPSGCGKTTTLRIIAGLTGPDTGNVILEERDVTALPPEKRNVNTVFQNYALFPHMNVANNIAYGLRVRRAPKQTIRTKIEEMLALVQLEGFAKRMPAQLSGGQRQRVAIARALVCNPALLLLDEPLGALDLQLRRQMQLELKRLQEKLGITFVYITHDQEEALNMSDRIAVMNDGGFEQIGAPDVIYEQPATRFVAQFIGQANLMEARVTQIHENSLTLLHGDQTVLASAPSDGALKAGDSCLLCVRTERLHYAEMPHAPFTLTGMVMENRYTGGALITRIRLPSGEEWTAGGHGRADEAPAVGSTVHLWWDPAQAAVVGGGRGGA
ncbi:MAG: ABC transporter ATP-binding protein [Clostridia bacterium]|nr:ABC transporter ATP-binding protein [Clostridia bacterium]